MCAPVLLSVPFHPLLPNSLPSSLPKVIAGDPQPASTSGTSQVSGMGLCMPSSWQKHTQEMQVVLVASLSITNALLQTRGEFLLVHHPFHSAQVLLAASRSFGVKRFSWEFPSSSTACSHCWASVTVLVQLPEGPYGEPDQRKAKKGYF